MVSFIKEIKNPRVKFPLWLSFGISSAAQNGSIICVKKKALFIIVENSSAHTMNTVMTTGACTAQTQNVSLRPFVPKEKRIRHLSVRTK